MLVIGRKEKNVMKKKIKYTDEPIKLGATVKDFLPPPEDLALKDRTVQGTLNLYEKSIKFFKEEVKSEGITIKRGIA